MPDHRVRVIFRTDFGERLSTLNLAVPTWIVGSSDNDPTISSLWQAEAGSITKFVAQDFDSLLGTIDEHHPGWKELEVHGLNREHAQHTLHHRGIYSSEGADTFVFEKAE
ncbi:MAG: hypothetical protein ABIL01_13415 [Pseudomonadota bacterium]